MAPRPDNSYTIDRKAGNVIRMHPMDCVEHIEKPSPRNGFVVSSNAPNQSSCSNI